MATMMKAMARTAGGYEVVEVPVPEPDRDEVRVRVAASSINPADEKVARGDFAGRFLHGRATPLILGYDLSGTVDAVGAGVTDLEVGAPVFGHLAYSSGTARGAFAEQAVLPAANVAPRPDAVDDHVAAAAATVGLTALQSLRDIGGLPDGGRALIVGAGGGVGSLAVGVGKRLGAHVTGICSTRDVGRVEALGADEVVDRKQTDPLAIDGRFDVIFDTPSAYSYASCAHLLAPGGTYVATLPGPGMLWGKLATLFSSKRCSFVVVTSRRADLERLGGWLADGLEVPIDSRHPISALGAAMDRQTQRDRAGKVVIDVAGAW